MQPENAPILKVPGLAGKTFFGLRAYAQPTSK
jgi:hypothetical protein